MSPEKKAVENRQTGLMAMLAIIAVLLAGVLVTLVILVVRAPSAPNHSKGAAQDEDFEEPPAEPTPGERGPGPAGKTTEGERPDTPVVISGARIYKRTIHETGVFVLTAPTQVLRDPQSTSKVVRLLPEGATCSAIGRQGEYRLVQGKEGSESFEGWILVASTQAFSAAHGGLAGTVRLSGHAPAMQVPAKRRSAEVCKTKDIVHNAVLANGGKLQDVLVRIAPRSVPGEWRPPQAHAVLEHRDCVYVPRMQGALSGQAIDILSEDDVMHNVHAYQGGDSYFNLAQPPRAAPIIKKALDEPGVMRFECDLHPWTRSFVVVTDHPFFAVTDEDGRFAIQGVPPGKYTVEALHSQYGVRRLHDAVITEGATASADFTFTTDDPAPDWNPDELTGLW